MKSSAYLEEDRDIRVTIRVLYLILEKLDIKHGSLWPGRSDSPPALALLQVHDCDVRLLVHTGVSIQQSIASIFHFIGHIALDHVDAGRYECVHYRDAMGSGPECDKADAWARSLLMDIGMLDYRTRVNIGHLAFFDERLDALSLRVARTGHAGIKEQFRIWKVPTSNSGKGAVLWNRDRSSVRLAGVAEASGWSRNFHVRRTAYAAVTFPILLTLLIVGFSFSVPLISVSSSSSSSGVTVVPFEPRTFRTNLSIIELPTSGERVLVSDSGQILGSESYSWPVVGTGVDFSVLTSTLDRANSQEGGWITSEDRVTDLLVRNPIGGIYAIGKGTVTYAAQDASGYSVVVSHSDGSRSMYLHMGSLLVSEGLVVDSTTVLGFVDQNASNEAGDSEQTSDRGFEFKLITDNGVVNPLRFLLGDDLAVRTLATSSPAYQ